MSEETSIFTKEHLNYDIPPTSVVKVYEYKDCPYVTATAMSNIHKPTNPWKKISKNELINVDIGEIRTYNPNNSMRIDNSDNIRRSQIKLVQYIRNNFSSYKKLKLHIVLTFRSTVYEYDIAMSRWKIFRDRMRHRFPKVEFIAIFEYYEKGKNKNGIHIHLLLLPNFTAITRDDIQHYWTFGFVYMKDFNSETATYFVKSNTLHLYPKGKRLYTKSKGIIMPVPKEMTYQSFINKMKNEKFECSLQKSVDIVSKDNINE